MDKNLHRIVGSDRLSKYVDSEYLGSGQLDLDEEYIFTIDKLYQGKISTGGKAEQQVVITFKERFVNGVEAKPMILNATNRRTLKKLYGSDSAEVLEGKPIIIYVETGVRDPRTGGTTEGLRIRGRKPQPTIPENYTCSDCEKPVKTSGEFSIEQIADVARRRHGVVLCAECLAKRKAAAPRTENATNE